MTVVEVWMPAVAVVKECSLIGDYYSQSRRRGRARLKPARPLCCSETVKAFRTYIDEKIPKNIRIH